MIPKYAKELIAKKFGTEKANLIEANWFYYADQRMSFGSSTEGKILREAGLVLECIGVGGDLSKCKEALHA